LRLRQICCHPKLYSETSKGSSSKMEALIDHVEAILDQGNKVLVFSQFVEMLNILVKEARKRSWAHWLLTGQSENRGQLVKDFQSSEGAGIFFISLKAGGAGLNLTSAQYVILFDPWWNPAVENQAIDRTHRIGQTNRVVAYRLLAKNTVEEKIRNLQKSKSELAAEVLDESKFSESLTMEDIQYIFQDDGR
jgi:SNF2 family DNA or RNA helicase